jgi:hypothetical protein
MPLMHCNVTPIIAQWQTRKIAMIKILLANECAGQIECQVQGETGFTCAGWRN